MGDPFKFEAFLDKIREKYYSYLSFQSSKFYMRGEFFNYSFLLDENNEDMSAAKVSIAGN